MFCFQKLAFLVVLVALGISWAVSNRVAWGNTETFDVVARFTVDSEEKFQEEELIDQ